MDSYRYNSFLNEQIEKLNSISSSIKISLIISHFFCEHESILESPDILQFTPFHIHTFVFIVSYIHSYCYRKFTFTNALLSISTKNTYTHKPLEEKRVILLSIRVRTQHLVHTHSIHKEQGSSASAGKKRFF